MSAGKVRYKEGSSPASAANWRNRVGEKARKKQNSQLPYPQQTECSAHCNDSVTLSKIG